MSDLAEKASHSRYMGSPYVREAVEGWLAYIGTERQLAAKTSEAYERDVSQFLAFLDRPDSVKTLRDAGLLEPPRAAGPR